MSTEWEEYQRLVKKENQVRTAYHKAWDEYISLGFLQIFSYKKRKKVDELRKARQEIFELTNSARDKWWKARQETSELINSARDRWMNRD